MFNETLTTRKTIRGSSSDTKIGTNITKKAMKKAAKDNWPIEEVLSFMRSIQHQLSYINQSIQSLKEWGEFRDHNRILHDNLKLSGVKVQQYPHVVHENITVDCNTEYDVIILVTSFAQNFERRVWIRNTWGSSQIWLNKKKWKVIFNVGAVKTDAKTVNES